MNKQSINKQYGFTMIEMMVTMAIALVLMAGMTGMFVSQTRTAQVLNSKSEVLNDLFLASQIMQFELRGAKAICWDSSKKLIRYQPLSSSYNLDTGCALPVVAGVASNTVKKALGYFQRKNKNTTGSHPTPYIFWNRVGKQLPAELIRGMKKNAAMTVSPTANVVDVYGKLVQTERTIKLTAQYLDKEHQTRDLSLSFKVWPRNTQ